jgi:hypothetical protein
MDISGQLFGDQHIAAYLLEVSLLFRSVPSLSLSISGTLVLSIAREDDAMADSRS